MQSILNTPVAAFATAAQGVKADNATTALTSGYSASTTVIQPITSLPATSIEKGQLSAVIKGNTKVALQQDTWATSLDGWTSDHDGITSSKYRITHTSSFPGFRDKFCIFAYIEIALSWLFDSFKEPLSSKANGFEYFKYGLVNLTWFFKQ